MIDNETSLPLQSRSNNFIMDSFEERIENLRKESSSGDVNRIADALEAAIDLLEELYEEKESVWQMLEELKASDMNNHKNAQYESIDKALSRAQMLMMAKVGKA
tara:strand:- start:15 stop:326 length:312 start_codon:yes stop_codon:yes gene_type:complete